MRRTLALLAIISGLIFAAGQSFGQLPLTGAGKGAPGGGGTSSVTPDVVGTQAYQAGSGNFNKTPINITSSLTNPALVCVWLRADVTNDTVAGAAMTWNGTNMPFSVTIGKFANAESVLIFGLRNPTSGSHTLNASATNTAADNFVNCVSFYNVNPASDAAAFPNNNTSAVSANTIDVTSASGHIVVGGFNNTAVSGSLIGTQVISDFVSGSVINATADYVVSTGTPTTVGNGSGSAVLAGVDVSN